MTVLHSDSSCRKNPKCLRKLCRPRSDCSFRSSLIRVYMVCLTGNSFASSLSIWFAANVSKHSSERFYYRVMLNSFIYPRADNKIFVCELSKNVKSKLYHTENSKSVDLNEVAHYEPPHQDLRHLQIQLFSSLVL